MRLLFRRLWVFELHKHSGWLGASLLAAYGAVAAAPAPRVAVSDLLRTLSATGVNVLYSSELVPPTLDAPDALPQAEPLPRVAAALAANGLTLRRTGDRTYVVSRMGRPGPSSTPKDLVMAPTAGVPAHATLDEVSVFASRYEFTTLVDGEPEGYDQRQIEQMPGAKGDSVRALRTAPGLATNLSARPYVRGAQLDDLLVEYDGIAMADPFHFRDFQSIMSVFSPFTVSRADIYTGGFPVNFGTRSGGVIDLVPASVESGYEYAVGASLLSYDLETVGRSDTLPLEWLLVARSSSDDAVLKRLFSETGEPDFYDVVGHLRWTVDPSSALTLGWLVLYDQVTFDSESPEEQANGRSRDVSGWLRWDWTPSPELQSRSSLAVATTERDNRGNFALPDVAVGSLRAERDFATFALRSDWTYSPRPTISFKFGGEFARENADLSFVRQETLALPIAPAFGRPTDVSVASNQYPHASTAGAYVSAHRRWQGFEAEIGLRGDAQDYRGFGVRGQVTPRANLRYDFSDRWHAYGSWGQFTQAQRVDEFRAEVNQLTPDSANRATHLIAGIAHESTETFSWRLEAYRHHWATISPYFDNLLGPISILPQLEPDRVLVTPSDADAAGLEISAQRSFSREFSVWGGYSRSTVTDDYGGREVPRSWDQPQAANVGVAWTTGRTSASTLLSWHSGWPRTPLSVFAATPTAPAYSVVGPRNSARWGSFFSADVRLSTAVPLFAGELSLWLDGVNITNRGNTCCVDLDSTSVSGMPDVNYRMWAPRVVNVGFTYKVRRSQ